jgi:hypothetical protein
MRRTWLLLLLPLLMGQSPPPRDSAASEQAAKNKRARLLEIDTNDAASFSIFRDVGRTQKLELKREPVYRWTNPTRSGGQEGDVFVWTYRGRPEVVASIFSHPSDDGTMRVVCHELQSLSLKILIVDREADEQWVPQAPGVDLKPVVGAAAPADSPGKRLVQMRSLAREFAGRSKSNQGQEWELRLLSQPLYRYESTDPDVLDGALYALVSSAGTDPEIILVLEAKKTPAGHQWAFGATRFSDMSLWLQHKGQDVWSAIRDSGNTFNNDASHRYRFYRDRIIPEISNGDSTGAR